MGITETAIVLGIRVGSQRIGLLDLGRDATVLSPVPFINSVVRQSIRPPVPFASPLRVVWLDD